MQNGRGDDYSIIISLPCIKHATKLSGCIDVGSFYFPVKNSGTGSIVENYNIFLYIYIHIKSLKSLKQ